ncbi:MAG: transcription elongation factor GreA [Chloroflexota bacterium]|nr:transcription elongation factor GreA [Chloroflexota bacterium]
MRSARYRESVTGTIPRMPDDDEALSGPSLLRKVGLLPDGPLPWGRPVPGRSPGVFLVELPAPLPTAPIELTRVGKWLEHVPGLMLDGARPTSRALSARLASFWLPSQTVLYVGATAATISGRLAAMGRTTLGDRRPYAGGHWLMTLRTLPSSRVWWAATEAVEEYEDALLAAFAETVVASERAGLHDPDVVLPFANLRRPTGERKASGLSGSLLPEPVEPAPPPTRVVVLPDGDAEGARGEPPEPRHRAPRATPSPSPAPTSSRAGGGESPSAPGAARPPEAPPTATPGGPAATLTAEGAERLRAELAELTGVKRPEVIARIRAAKELGDLKENADYSSAREEQSFLEGRVQAIEAQLRSAVIAVAPSAGAGADLGSRIVVEIDGDTDTYTLVGTAEADPSSGRLSVASPVGRALLGAVAGDEVAVKTPRGAVNYRVVSVE